MADNDDICKKVCQLCPGELVGSFGWPDILLFVVMLVISAGIGAFYMIREARAAKKATSDDILMGGRDIGVFPIAMSLMASFMSAITVLGTPTEMYNNNTSFWIASWAMIPTAVITNHVFLPFFHKLNLTSAYEYLENRFNRSVRVCASILFLLNMLLFMGVVLYAPSLALNSVTGLSLELCIAIIGVVCTFYTALGGLRAVVWTDTFQTFVVMAGLVAVAVQGSIEVGGVERVWQIANEKGRIFFFDWDPDPTVRHSVWSLIIGSWVGQLTIYAANQTTIQRYLAIKKIHNSQKALYMSIPPTLILSCLVCFVGLVIFAVYNECDPYMLGHVKARDQLLPFLVMDKLTFLPGLAGLFVASLFSASLSSISSGLNALSIVFLEDILKLAWEARDWVPSTVFVNRTAKVIGLVFGGVVIAVAFLARLLGQTVLQIVLSIFGMSGGPLLGLFICGIFIPFINAWGALCGLILSTAMAFWAGVGSTLVLPVPPVNNVSINACDDWVGVLRNCSISDIGIASILNSTIAVPSVEPYGQDLWIYHMSYLWYALYAVLVSVLTGVIVTFITSTCTGFNTPSKVKASFIHQACDRLCCYLPLSCVKVNREEKEDEIDFSNTDWIFKTTGHVPPWKVNDDDYSTASQQSEQVNSYDVTEVFDDVIDDAFIAPKEHSSRDQNGNVKQKGENSSEFIEMNNLPGEMNTGSTETDMIRVGKSDVLPRLKRQPSHRYSETMTRF
ncbi:sodium-coupled monocarboxylate transporter 1-like isoform X1 [Haliotis asinina]|uniref:sodium-coupled monocarboxylate transporter 1-like isoform X1 n=1 Tax=Haliotis asinina TaxID=109174 RepID=UPI003532618A